MAQTDKTDNKATPAALPNCWMEITIGGENAGRVEFKLYDDVVPKTAANFRALGSPRHQWRRLALPGRCSCQKPNGDALPPKFGYVNTPFHRVIPGFMCQGGDFERKDGTGGISIYGGKFDDENFKIKHTKPGLLSSANAGQNTNGSQFFVTLAKCEWLDGRHVVFGEVVVGMDVVKQIEKSGSDNGKIIRDKIPIVKACGVV
ncbi:hypothetical protein Q5752_005135 [Cryptotrichosporon argae]